MKYRSEEDRQALCQWLRDHGLDPNAVHEDGLIEIGPSTVSVEVFDLNAAGKRYAVGDTVATKPITVDRVRDLPELTSAGWNVQETT